MVRMRFGKLLYALVRRPSWLLFLFLLGCSLAGCGKSGLDRALSEHRELAERAMKERDYELASSEYQNVMSLVQQVLMKEREAAAKRKQPLKERDTNPIEKAAGTHRQLAESFLKDKEYDLAVSEYQSVLNLLQLAQSRVQQNLGAKLQVANREEIEERDEIQKWFQKESSKKDLSEKRRKEVQQQYQEKLAALDKKFQPNRERQQKEQEKLQKEVEKQVRELGLQRVALYESIAKVYADKGDKPQAKTYEMMVHQERAALYQQQNDRAKAEAEYRNWVKSSPNDFNAHSGLAQVLMSSQKLPEAEKEFRWMVERSPDNPGLRMQLAEVLVRQKKLDGAIQQRKEIIRLTAQQAARIPPGAPNAAEQKKAINRQVGWAYLDLGRLLLNAKRKDEAKQAFDKAKALSPDLALQIPAVSLPPSPG